MEQLVSYDINPAYVMWVLALPSPIMTFLALVWVKMWAKWATGTSPGSFRTKRSRTLILGSKQMLVVSGLLALGMTIITNVLGFVLSRLASFSLEWKIWLAAVTLTFCCWMVGTFLGLWVFVKLFGATLYKEVPAKPS